MARLVKANDKPFMRPAAVVLSGVICTINILRHIVLMIANHLPRYHHVDYLRVALYRFAGLQIGPGTRIAGPLIVDLSVRSNTLRHIEIGRNSYINFNCRISAADSQVTIGDDCLVGPNVSFETSEHSIEPRHHRKERYTRPIVVGNNVWIGANALVLPGVTIADDVIIAAGAVVTRDVREGTVVGGVPARPLREAREDWHGQ